MFSRAHAAFVVSTGLAVEAAIRLALCVVFYVTDVTMEPFVRVIHEEEAWLYANPLTASYFPTSYLWTTVALAPPAAVAIAHAFFVSNGWRRRDCATDIVAAALVVTLLMPLNGVVTNLIKLTVGRPRPFFIAACFPDGKIPADFYGRALPLSECTNPDAHVVRDARKSFPSGHSSFSFAVFTFSFLYLAGKARSFTGGNGGRKIPSVLFLLYLGLILAPTMIAISRTCDYHHHWQDIAVGSLLGVAHAYAVYRVYYPPITSDFCHVPNALLDRGPSKETTAGGGDVIVMNRSDLEASPMLHSQRTPTASPILHGRPTSTSYLKTPTEVKNI